MFPCRAAQVQRFLDVWIQGTNVVTYTPGGLAWSAPWGPLRYTANAALIAVVYGKYINGERVYMCPMMSAVQLRVASAFRSCAPQYTALVVVVCAKQVCSEG